MSFASRAAIRPILAAAFALLWAAAAGSIIVGFAAMTLRYLFTGAS